MNLKENKHINFEFVYDMIRQKNLNANSLILNDVWALKEAFPRKAPPMEASLSTLEEFHTAL